MKRLLRIALPAIMAAALVTAALLHVSSPAAMAVGETQVTINGQTHKLDGTDVRRLTNYLVLYTKSGTRTGTNSYGTEAAVVNGKVTKLEIGVGNMLIPSGGYVLSGHGTSSTWLKTYAKVGASVSLNGNTQGGTPKLPDIGIRTLRQFTIVRPTSGQFAGRKLLKFPGVTANVGDGALEIKGVRSTSTSTDWVAQQVLYNTDGTKTTLPPASGATFYYAGDGHTHWHIKDFDSYELLSQDGTVLQEGEKHGFCFEDNTNYRDWASKGTNGAPANPVYDPTNVCGVKQPQATQILHGLSVGWSDTYPATLPDQAIDITGIADGQYMVKVTADWQHFWAEKNENNNTATAQVRITGDTVTLISATDGL